MVPLKDKNMLKIDEMNNKSGKIEKSVKILKTHNIIKFKTARYQLTASSNIIHSIIN